MTILPNEARVYVAELLPLFDRREVKRFGWFKADEAIYLEVFMHGGWVHVIRHLPPTVDTHKVAIEIMDAWQ